MRVAIYRDGEEIGSTKGVHGALALIGDFIEPDSEVWVLTDGVRPSNVVTEDTE